MMTREIRNQWSEKLLFTCFLALSTQACVVPSGDPAQRTSLFGSSSRVPRGLPLPPSSAVGSQMPVVSGKALQNLENVAPSGAILPQLSGALAGNASHGGFSHPMVSSPLLFQRLDKNTWRVATAAPHLFQTVARILSQTYIVSKADRQTLSLSTEWDKFFIDGRLFRNRISINVFPFNQRSADLVIKNNIEYYTQTAQRIDENNPTQWLPTQDVTDELERILEKTQKQLMASLSGQNVRTN
jgi:hypothetical protein